MYMASYSSGRQRAPLPEQQAAGLAALAKYSRGCSPGREQAPLSEQQAAGLAALARLANSPETTGGFAALRDIVRVPSHAMARRRARKHLRPQTRIVALIPAHNESAAIAGTIHSLRRQTLPPDEITVVCDNCTDDTADISSLNGAKVISTIGNNAKKAGAINQGLTRILPGLADDDLVLIIDADSQLDRDWIRNAQFFLRNRPRPGAVCGAYQGESGNGLIGQLQRNEFGRAVHAIRRMRAITVLSGCGTLFRAAALQAVAEERGSRLPGRHGRCFDGSSITEDYEMTLALKTLGYECLCCVDSVAITELMPTWRDLFHQRVRWQRGALSDLRQYGITRYTWRDWLRQAFTHFSYVVLIMCWAAFSQSFTGFNIRWGLSVLVVTVLERVWTVRRIGFRAMLLAALILPEFAYGIFKGSYLAWSAFAEFTRRDTAWIHASGDAT